uniref:Uncharacterized protein n=1 Tax=Cannabis sativa TaxID=3483 RepID=A0A803RC59_CANSA
MIQRETHLGALALVVVVLIQRGGVAVAVGAVVTVGAEAGANLQKPKLHVAHRLNLDQDLGLVHALARCLDLGQDLDLHYR